MRAGGCWRAVVATGAQKEERAAAQRDIYKARFHAVLPRVRDLRQPMSGCDSPLVRGTASLEPRECRVRVEISRTGDITGRRLTTRKRTAPPDAVPPGEHRQ